MRSVPTGNCLYLRQDVILAPSTRGVTVLVTGETIVIWSVRTKTSGYHSYLCLRPPSAYEGESHDSLPTIVWYTGNNNPYSSMGSAFSVGVRACYCAPRSHSCNPIHSSIAAKCVGIPGCIIQHSANLVDILGLDHVNEDDKILLLQSMMSPDLTVGAKSMLSRHQARIAAMQFGNSNGLSGPQTFVVPAKFFEQIMQNKY